MPNPRCRPSRLRSAFAAVALVAIVGAATAAADRLPLAGGGWIETRGPWKLEGKRIVYRTPEGNLRSLPLAEAALGRRDAGGNGEAGARPAGEYPWGRPIVIAEPPPPARRVSRGRRPLPAAPPRCLLANAGAGEDPAWVCADPPPGGRAR